MPYINAICILAGSPRNREQQKIPVVILQFEMNTKMALCCFPDGALSEVPISSLICNDNRFWHKTL